MLIPRVVQLQYELAVSRDYPFRHILLGFLVICESLERRRVRRRQRIRLSGQLILRQAYRILPVQAFQIVLYRILRVAVSRERSGYLHILCRHLERIRDAPAAERVAFLHRLCLDTYLLAVPVALCAFICLSVHLVCHVVVVPRVVQFQYQASISCNRSGCQRTFYRRVIRKAFVGVQFCSYSGICRFCECLCLFRIAVGSVEALQIMFHLIFRIRIRYRASFNRNIAGWHLEVFLLAPAAEVVTCRYPRCWPYGHFAVVFVWFYISILNAVQHVGHVVALNFKGSFDLQILRTHYFWKGSVPAAESVAFLHRLFSQRGNGLAVLVGV